MDIKYDEAAIKMGGNFAENFFYNFDAYKDKFNPQTIFMGADFDTIKKRNALDNYILKYYDKVNDSVQKNMDKYLSAFYRSFLANPSELLGSPFLRSSEIVTKFCPERVQIKNQEREIRKHVIHTYKENSKDSQLLYSKDQNSGNLSREETNRLMHFFIKNIGTENKEIQKAQEKYIKKLIGQTAKTSDLEPKQIEFIARYVNNYMLSSRLKQLGYNRNEIQNNIYVGEERETLGGFENEYNIYINKNSLLTQNIPDLIQTVCHETEHSIQELEARKNPKSKVGLDLAISNILRNYFSSEKGYDVYHNNYRFEEIEKDAEKFGDDTAIVFLDQLGFKELADDLSEKKNTKQNTRQFEYDFRTNEDGKKSVREKFIFENLNKAISKNPKLLSEYPGLENLYNKDGKVKNFKQLLMQEFKLNEAGKSAVFEDFCKLYISQGELENLNLSEFPEEMQTNIASRLISILASEKIQLSQMDSTRESAVKSRLPITKEDQKHVEGFHLGNSKKIMDFINQNYQQLMRLQKDGKFSSVIDMDTYNSNVKAFANLDFYQNFAFDDKYKIADIMKVANEAIEQKQISRNSSKFTPSNLESSFQSLIDDTKLSDFQQTTQNTRKAVNLTKTTEQEMEAK